MPEISVARAPAALRITVEEDGTETQELLTNPADIPTGEWAITIVEESGQTWPVPNQLAASPRWWGSEGYDPTLQAVSLTIEP